MIRSTYCTKFLCWPFFFAFFACQERKQTSETQPDAVRDLLIDRSFWKEVAAPLPQRRPASMHRFTITNTSHQFTYRRIDIQFDYYDQGHHKIGSAIRTIDRTIEPRAAIKVDSVSTDVAKEGTASATATVIRADTN